MSIRLTRPLVPFLALVLGCSGDSAQAPIGVTRSALGWLNTVTRNYDNGRSGANINEITLNRTSVSSPDFGKLFELPVDDQVYAEPLYVSGIVVNGISRNVVYVATVNNSAFAFDADDGTLLWTNNFNNGFVPPNHTQVGQSCSGGYNDFSGKMGIVGTPVIDGTSGTMYLVTRTVERNVFVQRLRAVDISSGNERAPSRTITIINAKTNNQRAALALSQGLVYVAWSSHCDTTPYHGRVIAFDTGTLTQVASFDTAPQAGMAGIWMAGAGPVIDDAGNLFYATGNTKGSVGASDFPESIVKLSPSLSYVDHFMASNRASLDSNDLDLGSSGPIMIPDIGALVMGGKGGGTCYLVNMSNMGHRIPGDAQIPQKWQCVDPDNIRPSLLHHLHNAMVAWRGPFSLNLYTWGENDFGRMWRFNGGTFNVPAASVSNVLPPQGMPGGMMSLSAAGSTIGTGILWVSMPLSGDANHKTVPGVLRAFDAEDLTVEIWNSARVSADNSRSFSKGSVPMVANGRVYLGTLSNVVAVYGLRRAPDWLQPVVTSPLL